MERHSASITSEHSAEAMAEDFTLAGYQALIASFRARGYVARGYEEADPTASHLIVRHDLDMSIEAALPVAAIESEAEWQAHYFVLMRSIAYNPAAPDTLAGLRHIVRLGHALGLHFDASLYPDDDEALEAGAARECAALEALIEQPVTLISFHRPAKRLQGYPGRLAGRIHAYQPRFFTKMGYCSDSRGRWDYGHPLDHDAVAAGRALQLLTHPIWWWREQRETVQDRLDNFCYTRLRRDREELARNCEPYDPSHTPPWLRGSAS